MAKTAATFEKEGVEDLVLLPKVSEEGIVDNLKKRYNIDQIYTNIGPVLISVNPFRYIKGLCDPEQVDDYKNRFRHEVPPNVFALAEEAYRAMKNQQENQCIIITGESGAGKTEAAKLIMKYISAVSGNSAEIDYVKDVILDSNPLLEAFGNAKTLRNNNSSRFGKYFEIQFDRLGDPVGGKINHYLLEKSRVVRQIKGERSFHIFYQLLAGATAEERGWYSLTTPDQYGYMAPSECYTVENMDDVHEFAEVRKAMTTIGMDTNLQQEIWSLVAAIMHIGNIYFEEDNSGNAKLYQGDDYVNMAAHMLSCDKELLKKALLSRVINTGQGDKMETYISPNNLVQADASRDALAKTIYSRIFDLLIERTNMALGRYQLPFSCVIGVLDIYGFEIFKNNGFEQFCINYVNEKLQQYFIELTLKTEQEEYNAEGIQWTPIKYFNNKVVCDLIEGKQPPGLFSILDDVCYTMHAQGGGLDNKFVEKGSGIHSTNIHYRGTDGAFEIKHYAGEVMYTVEGFCERNKDSITNDLIEAVQSSQINLLRSLFPEDTSAKQSKRPTTSGFKIKTSAQALIQKLSECSPHYIRCIKPNETKKAKDWDEDRVKHQVKYLGLLENVRVRRAGFAYRAPYQRFLDRYKKLSDRTWGKGFEWTGDAKEGAIAILQSSALDAKQWQLGKTKIFIRHPESLFFLEECLERYDYEKAALIQKAWRKWKGKKKALEARAMAANLLKNKKERRRDSVNRKFDADYVNYDNHFGLQGGMGKHREERLLFGDQIVRFNRRCRPERRDLVVTAAGVYITMRITKNKVESYKLVRRIALTAIQSVSLSTLQDNFVVLHAEGNDIIFECSRKTELITVLNEQLEQQTRQKLTLNFSDNVKAAIGRGQDFREVKFSKNESATVAQVKKQGKSILISINSGLDKSTDSTPQGFSLGTPVSSAKKSGGVKKTGVAKQTQPVQQPVQQPMQVQQPVHHEEPQQQIPSGPKKSVKKVAPKQAQQPKPSVPQCKALYDYPGSGDNELGFKAGEIITIIQKDPAGWWEGELNGKRGWIPANYVQEL